MLYPFDAFLEEELPLPGRKAESLLNMLRLQLPVPPGACILPSAYAAFIETHQQGSVLERFWQGQLSSAELEQMLAPLPLPAALHVSLAEFLAHYPDQFWAVRSSGLLEDLEDASFAGLYLTRLNVSGQADIEAAIKACWLSQYHPRVQQYIQSKALDPRRLQMGVILQVMIPAEKSGVVFTVNPLKGRDTEMLVEAVYGLGEALVSGAVTPDQYAYDWQTGVFSVVRTGLQTRQWVALPEPPFTAWKALSETQSTQPVLTQTEAEALAALALRVQQACGYPVDLEWVYANQQFWLVQSRPITRFHYQEIAGEWTTADFKDGGVSSSVCTPLMWSLYDFIWERTLPAYLRKTGLLAQEAEGVLWGDMFFGRPYWNVGAVKAGLRSLPGFVEREFDTDLGIEPSYQGLGYVTPVNPSTLWQGFKVLTALQASFRHRLRYCEQYAPRQRQRLEILAQYDTSSWSDAQFFDFYKHLILSDYFICESSYFYLIFDNSNVTTLFKDALKPYRAEVNYLNLISGLRNVSHLQQNFALWDLSRAIREKPEALKYWSETPVRELCADWKALRPRPWMSEVSQFIRDFGYHSTRELDLRVPRYREDPSFVFERLKQLLPLGPEHDPRILNARQYQAFEQERERLKRLVPFWKRNRLLEELERLRSFLWWREELRDLSSRMYERVRFFTLLLAERLVRTGQLQTTDDIFFCPIFSLLDLLAGKVDGSDLQSMIEKKRCYYESFRHFKNPNEIGSRYTGNSEQIATDTCLKGVPCSPGEVIAPACVVENIFAVDRLKTGDILITRFTDPGWTPVFSQISGVATETGGLLSHAAVIAREYGIPAVLAVPGLMERVKDGQKIRLDGNRGEVELLD